MSLTATLSKSSHFFRFPTKGRGRFSVSRVSSRWWVTWSILRPRGKINLAEIGGLRVHCNSQIMTTYDVKSIVWELYKKNWQRIVCVYLPPVHWQCIQCLFIPFAQGGVPFSKRSITDSRLLLYAGTIYPVTPQAFSAFPRVGS